MPQPGPYNLATSYLRLRPDAAIEPLAVSDSFWMNIAAGELGDFHNEYLVTIHSFDKDWSLWEMHPNGDEVVCLLSGSVSFVLEEAERRRAITLQRNGAYVIVPRGTWHTAKVVAPSQMLFITAGEGTQHRDA